jgi:hypothetical protein
MRNFENGHVLNGRNVVRESQIAAVRHPRMCTRFPRPHPDACLLRFSVGEGRTCKKKKKKRNHHPIRVDKVKLRPAFLLTSRWVPAKYVDVLMPFEDLRCAAARNTSS